MKTFRTWRINRLKDKILHKETKADLLAELRRPNGQLPGGITIEVIDLRADIDVLKQKLARLEAA